MCGITGLYAFNMVGRINLIHLEAATRCLEKRGPDNQGSWFDDVVGLGHRRLSVIDTSAEANQPMIDESGRFRIIFNGEIYNYREIRQELVSNGITFRTESDTEVQLQAFIYWGPACLNRLNGFFAFAIYDQKEEYLLIARDRLGIKPLLYYHDDDKVLFASEMKSILSYGVPRKLNTTALHLFFQLTYIPAPLSIIDGVKKLKPGCFLSISRKNGLKVKRYYEVPYTEKPEVNSFDEAKKLVRQRLTNSVHRRLVADVPLGTFLSGGIDSSIITALAAREVEKLDTFSIGFKGHGYFDESKYARMVADRYKTNHHEFMLSNSDLHGHLYKMIQSIDEPFADSSALPVHLLASLTRKEVTVALSGDGADEIFSGYNKHSAWAMSKESGLRNKLITNLDWLWTSLPKSRNSGLSDKVRQLHRMADLLKMKDDEKYWFLASFTGDDEISRLLKSNYQASSKNLRKFKSTISALTGSGSLNEMLNADTQLVLPNDMLQKVDLMSMANSLEVRVPFLDHEVVQLAFNLPERFKVDGMKRKIILKEAFADMIPEELISRPKHGFEVPLLEWFRKEMRGDLDDWVFDRERVEDQGIFQWDEIKRVREKLHSSDPGDVTIKIWSLFIFQKWYYTYCSTS
ncbi:MAG: asparagine synthase (glutamine-hydrolyzing) [Cyclobacteriaceae bacterium]|nr:asparagine synthase (glutamine-hydrolyzing) [Cyclobacteriaceae bacterium SS2]